MDFSVKTCSVGVLPLVCMCGGVKGEGGGVMVATVGRAWHQWTPCRSSGIDQSVCVKLYSVHVELALLIHSALVYVGIRHVP